MEDSDTALKDSKERIVKTVPIIRDFALNPDCDHGPTILFERNGERFFSCSAFRSRKLCRFFMSEAQWLKICRSMNKPGNVTDCDMDRGDRPAKRMKFDETDHPLVLPNQRNKGEAQYHFNEKTVTFLLTQLIHLKVDSVLCIGTPSLHQEIQIMNPESSGILNSFLLDIDQRFCYSFTKDFALYNMCNHHFFKDQKQYEIFLKKSKKLAVVVDPPFGVKVELIWHGCLSGVKKDLERLAPKDKTKKLEMFWVFPYFMEGHILSKCPDSGFQMSDFHVEYRNHSKYSGGPKTKSSPIRIFTTVPLSDLILPEDDYRFCDLCGKWVDKKNMHCNYCGTCTTKDGGPTYKHCKSCQKCVKPTWLHCSRCKICHLATETSHCGNIFNLRSVGQVPRSVISKGNKKPKKRNKRRNK